MKYFTYLCLLILLPVSAIAIDIHSTEYLPELEESTKNSMKRSANVTIDPQGQMNLDTSNSFRSVTFVRIGKNGKNETLCTTSEQEAKDFIAGKSIKPNTEGE